MALNEHKNLDGDNLHVSKGFTAASENTFQTKDERGATYWQANNYLPACLAIAVSTSAPPTETDGAIYILSNSGAPHANWDACLQTQWVRYRSSDGIWEGVTPSEGYLCYDKDTNALLRFDGADWGSSSSSPSIGGAITGATQYSILFADGAGIIAQDNTNLRFDNSTDTFATKYASIFGVNAAAGSASALTLSGTLGIMDGTDTFRGLYLNYTNAIHTGAGNVFNGIDISNITGSANCTETAINIGTGWDSGINIGGSTQAASLTIKGAGALNTTMAVCVNNSTPTALFELYNDGSFTLGLGNTVYDATCVTIGNTSVTARSGDIAIGYSVAISATGSKSVAIGYNVTAVGDLNTVVGGDAFASNSYCSIYGGGSSSGGNNNIVVGYNSIVTGGNSHVVIGNNVSATNGANTSTMIGHYNRQVNDSSISIVHDFTARTNYCGEGDTLIGPYMHFGSTAGSSGYNTMIGYGQEFRYGGTQTRNVMLGMRAKSYMDAGGNYSVAIGSYTQLGNSTAANTGILILGTGDGTNYLTNAEDNSLIFGFKAQYESFKLYKRGVFVFNGANAASVVDGTNVDASCTNTMAIVSGTAPVSAKTNTAQVFSNDSGQLCYLDENGFLITL